MNDLKQAEEEYILKQLLSMSFLGHCIEPPFFQFN